MDFVSQRIDVLFSAALETDAAFAAAARLPQAYRVVLLNVRRAMLRRFVYMVSFQAHENRIVILAVVHVRQSPNDWPFARQRHVLPVYGGAR